jgi:hypothetical protein
LFGVGNTLETISRLKGEVWDRPGVRFEGRSTNAELPLIYRLLVAQDGSVAYSLIMVSLDGFDESCAPDFEAIYSKAHVPWSYMGGNRREDGDRSATHAGPGPRLR